MIGGFYFDDELKNDNILSFGADARPFFDWVTGGIPPAGVPSALDDTEDAFLIPRGTFQGAGQGMVETFLARLIFIWATGRPLLSVRTTPRMKRM